MQMRWLVAVCVTALFSGCAKPPLAGGTCVSIGEFKRIDTDYSTQFYTSWVVTTQARVALGRVHEDNIPAVQVTGAPVKLCRVEATDTQWIEMFGRKYRVPR